MTQKYTNPEVLDKADSVLDATGDPHALIDAIIRHEAALNVQRATKDERQISAFAWMRLRTQVTNKVEELRNSQEPQNSPAIQTHSGSA